MSELYAGLLRKDVRVCNLSPYRLTDDRGKDRPPTEEEAAEFAPGLLTEIERTNPELIVCLGRHSASVVLGRPVSMEVSQGLTYRVGKRDVIIVVHPAAGLHEPSMLARTASGLEVVGRWLRGTVALAPQDELPGEYFRPILAIGRPPVLHSPVAIDTEGPIRRPWSLQWSCTPGSGRLIRADDPVGLAAFLVALETYRPTIIFHHALHDLDALLSLGIDILSMGLPWRDTMIESFLSQRHPQGLKALATRLCGMEMQTYEEVVGPVAERFAREYIQRAYAEPEVSWAFAEGRKHSIVRRLGNLLGPASSRATVNEPKTLREKWHEEGFAETRSSVEALYGPMPAPGMDDVPAAVFLRYAGRDPDATLRIAPYLEEEISGADLQRVRAVDCGALPLVLRMQRTGLLVDTHRLDELREYVSAELTDVTATIRAIVGDPHFNPASGDQVAAYCKAKNLGLEKLTKSGKREQVDENALMLIRFKDPAIEPFLYHRELNKLQGTYIEPLYGFLVGTGRYRRLYGHFRLTAAITGRMSMNDPNLMAYPVRDELGRRLRACIVAEEGHKLFSCDLSQIELRVGAGLSQDPRMIDAFVQDIDLHTRTAAKFFFGDDSPESMLRVDKKKQRDPVKTLNFGIFYGARGRRMEAEFLKAGIDGFDLTACDGMIEWWFGEYSGVGRWLADTYRFGREQGFVATEAGRRRYLPALRFDQQGYPFNRLREEAQRQAGNFPVQGTAQEMEKRGMKVVNDEVLPIMHDLGYFCEPLLQLHDDLLLEGDIECEEVLKELVTDAMTRESPWRGVPIKTSWASGSDWAACK